MRVLEGEGRRRKTIETVAHTGVIDAGVETDIVRSIPTHVPGGAEIVIAVGLTIAVPGVGRRYPVAAVVVRGNSIFNRATSAVCGDVETIRVERAAFRLRAQNQWFTGSALGQDIDDAADGIAAVERRLWTAQHFDAVYAVREHIAQNRVTGSGTGIVDPHAVHQYQCLSCLRTADQDVGRLAGTSVAHHGRARRSCQCVADNIDLLRIDVVGCDHRHGSSGHL